MTAPGQSAETPKSLPTGGRPYMTTGRVAQIAAKRSELFRLKFRALLIGADEQLAEDYIVKRRVASPLCPKDCWRSGKPDRVHFSLSAIIPSMSRMQPSRMISFMPSGPANWRHQVR